jgi:hypothetical protein
VIFPGGHIYLNSDDTIYNGKIKVRSREAERRTEVESRVRVKRQCMHACMMQVSKIVETILGKKIMGDHGEPVKH